MSGQAVAYRRVSTVDQNTDRQLEGMRFDQVFEDMASGKDAARPGLQALLKHVRHGDVVHIHSMDRLGRNIIDLHRIVGDLTARGVKVTFHKESLTFTGSDGPMATLLLSMLGAVAQFERELIRERQAEGIAIARRAGRYKGRQHALPKGAREALKARVAAGEGKTALAREYGISRETLYSYLRAA